MQSVSTKRETVTFQPNRLVKKLLRKAVKASGGGHGQQTRIINEALAKNLKDLIGKREQHLIEHS